MHFTLTHITHEMKMPTPNPIITSWNRDNPQMMVLSLSGASVEAVIFIMLSSSGASVEAVIFITSGKTVGS